MAIPAFRSRINTLTNPDFISTSTLKRQVMKHLGPIGTISRRQLVHGKISISGPVRRWCAGFGGRHLLLNLQVLLNAFQAKQTRTVAFKTSCSEAIRQRRNAPVALDLDVI